MTSNKEKPATPNFAPGVGRLVTDRFDFQQHVDGTAFRHHADQIDLVPVVNIQSFNSPNVQDAIQRLANLIAPSVPPDATTTSKGVIQLAGDLAGNAANVRVVGLQGFPVSSTTPTTNFVLTWNGSTWIPAAVAGSSTPTGPAGGDLGGTYPNPSVTALRGRTLNPVAPLVGQALEWDGSQWTPTSGLPPSGTAGGDLSGTYPSPTVIKINGSTVVTAGGSLIAGTVLQAVGASSVDYGAVNLGNANSVTGALPAGNQAPQTMGGDCTGTTAACIVTNGAHLTGIQCSGTANLNGTTNIATGTVLGDWHMNGNNTTSASSNFLFSNAGVTVAPTANGNGNLGLPTQRWGTFFSNSADINNLTVNGNATFTNAGALVAPSVDGNGNLGSPSFRWGHLYAFTANIGSGLLTISGNVTAASSTFLFSNAGVTVAPSVDNTGNLGLPTQRWSLIRGRVITSGDLNLTDEARESDWLLREQRTFILAVNKMTGEKFRLAMSPLTKDDEAELDANDPVYGRS